MSGHDSSKAGTRQKYDILNEQVMKKVHNFYAGPCVLPEQAVDKTIEALKDFRGTGIPVISISHRSKEWVQVMDECRALWKELLHIPDTHEVLFMGGGASMQLDRKSVV